MKVDELLASHILTPQYTCTVIKPNPGSLVVQDVQGKELMYAEVKKPYLQWPDNLDDYLRVTESGHTEFIETNDIKMLINCLRFAEKAQGKDGQYNFGMKDIKEFVYTYGFPITHIGAGINGTDEHLLLFDVQEFLNRLDNLYVCYGVWKALQLNDYDLLKQVQPYELNKHDMHYALSHRIRAQINLTLFYINDKPVLKYQTKNLISLVEAQLAALASKGDNYLDGGCIAYCADCGEPYIKYRSNATLCEKCKGNTGKSRRYRAKMKAQEKEV